MEGSVRETKHDRLYTEVVLIVVSVAMPRESEVRTLVFINMNLTIPVVVDFTFYHREEYPDHANNVSLHVAKVCLEGITVLTF